MPNTYTQIHLHFIFAAKHRAALIQPTWKERLHQYITGVLQHNNHKLLCINSMPDHLHVLVGFRPHQSISLLIQNVKSESTKWLKHQNLSPNFAWQEGYGAFSYSKSQVPAVVHYIQMQEERHKKQTFLDEYRSMLNTFAVEFDEQYIFKEPD